MAQFRSAWFNRIAAAAAYYASLFLYWGSKNKKKDDTTIEYYLGNGVKYGIGAIGVLLHMVSWVDMAIGIFAGHILGKVAGKLFEYLYKRWETSGDDLLPQ